MSRKEAILLLFLLTCFTFFVQWSGAEQRSFFSLILALHNDHSLRIDAYADLSPDRAFYNGHYYSDKAPGLSFLGLPFYALFNAMQGLGRAGLWLPYPIYLVSAFVVSVPAALLALLILRFLRRLAVSEGQAIAATLAMALGTLAFPFSTLFFSHQTAAFLVFAAFYSLYLGKTGAWPQSPALVAAGFIVGSAVLVEYPMVVMALLLGLYALSTLADKRRLALYILGGLPPALLLMAYNHAAFDHPLRLSYFYTVNTWAQVHQQGFLGVGLPRLATFLDVILGWRGLFTLSPVLLLAVPGLGLMARRRELRAETVLALAAVGTFLLLTSGYRVPPTDIWVPGPRFLIPVLPFLAVPLALALGRWPRLFALLAVVSMGIMFLVTAANPQVPPDVRNPLFHYWLPGFLDRSQLVRSLPVLRFGISRGLSLLLLGGVVSAAAGGALAVWLLRSLPRAQSLALNVLLVVMVLAYLTLAFPIDLRRPFDVPATLTATTALVSPVVLPDSLGVMP